MKLVGLDEWRLDASCCLPRMQGTRLQDNVSAALWTLVHAHLRRNNPALRKDAIAILEFLAQIHESTAFGIGGQARAYRVRDGMAHRRVSRQLRGQRFGKTTADEQTIQVTRKGAVVDGAERHNLDSQLAETLQVRRVIKTEGLVHGNADF